MTYKAPPIAIEHLEEPQASASTLTFRSAGGPAVEVEYLVNVGWSIEVRYDRTCANTRRAPFTGLQDKLKRLEMQVESNEQEFTLSGEGSVLLDWHACLARHHYFQPGASVISRAAGRIYPVLRFATCLINSNSTLFHLTPCISISTI